MLAELVVVGRMIEGAIAGGVLTNVSGLFVRVVVGARGAMVETGVEVAMVVGVVTVVVGVTAVVVEVTAVVVGVTTVEVEAATVVVAAVKPRQLQALE